MAHPKRKSRAVKLSESLGVEIVWDLFDDRHETGFRSIWAADPNADWHVVIQDDAVVCNDLLPGLREALRYVPKDAPVGLYHGGVSGGHAKAWSEAEDAGVSWLVRKGPVWGVGIVFPVSTILDLLRFYKSSQVVNYDRRCLSFYQSRGVDCWYTVPSLVDHANIKSLSGHDLPQKRNARAFLGPQSALSVDWSKPSLRSPS
jgi:hypothetical protein